MTAALATYDFHGDRLDVVERDGKVFVALKPMCVALGLDAKTQRRKLATKGWACGVMMTLQVGGQGREVFCLELDSVPMWLATIEPSKVGERVRGKLVRYQVECARVLRDHFLGRPEPTQRRDEEFPGVVQARIGDDARAMGRVRAMCRDAAGVTARTIQSIHGELRKPWGVASVYRIPLNVLESTIADIQRMIGESERRRRLPPDRRQMEMF